MKLPIAENAPDVKAVVNCYIELRQHNLSKKKALAHCVYAHALWTPVRIKQYTQAVLECKPIKSFGTTSHEHRYILGSCPRGSRPKQASAQTALIMKQKTTTKSAASRKRKKHVLTMVRRKAPTRPEHKFQVSTQGVTK